MNLIDLLNKINIEKVFDLYVNKYSDDKLKTANREKGFTNFCALIDEIKRLKLSGEKAKAVIVVVKLKSFDDDGYNFNAFEFNGDGERYAIDMTPWNELAVVNILDKSIELYGVDEVAAEILWEMTFWGNNEATHKKEVKKTVKSLKKASKCKKFYTMEEMEDRWFKKYGIPLREKKTEEQLAAEREKSKAIHEENKNTLNDLCGIDVIY